MSHATGETLKRATSNIVMAPCCIGNNGDQLGEALEGIFNAVLSCTVALEISAPIIA